MSLPKHANDMLNCSRSVIKFCDWSSHSSMSVRFRAARFHNNICCALFLFPIQLFELRDWLDSVSESTDTQIKYFEITLGCKLRPHTNKTHWACSVISFVLTWKIETNLVFPILREISFFFQKKNRNHFIKWRFFALVVW